MRRDLHAVADVIVSYSAGQMPTDVIDQLHTETIEQIHAGTTGHIEGVQILDLLLKIALQKVMELEERLAMTDPRAQQAAARIAGVAL